MIKYFTNRYNCFIDFMQSVEKLTFDIRQLYHLPQFNVKHISTIKIDALERSDTVFLKTLNSVQY